MKLKKQAKQDKIDFNKKTKIINKKEKFGMDAGLVNDLRKDASLEIKLLTVVLARNLA